MSTSPKISVLMPSLNVAPYIRRCMDSVLGQSLRDLEILCIDARSDDGTLEILRDYEARDPRVRVIVSEQRSYGHQMNLGLDAARGEYIGVVETDDWADRNMFEVLYTRAREHDADLVKGNYSLYYSSRTPADTPAENLAGCPYGRVFCPRQEPSVFWTAPSIWSGIYRRSLLAEAGIRFNETPGASYQDTSFFLMVLTAAERALLLNEYFLHYRQDNENASRHSRGKLYCVCDEIRFYRDYLDRQPLPPETKRRLGQVLMKKTLLTYRWNYDRLQPTDQWPFLRVMYDELDGMRSQGLLDRSCYSEGEWADLDELLSGPVRFYQRTCKKYDARPRDRALLPAVTVRANRQADPAVSIIIPAYNGADTLAACVASAAGQSLENIEILCVDDGSRDDTLSLMEGMAERDGRISVLHQTNQGLSSARNAGMEAARGRYRLFLDADDALRSDACEKLYAAAEAMELDLLYFDGESRYESEALRRRFPYYEHSYEYDLALQAPLSGRDYFCRAKEDEKYRVAVPLAFYSRAYLTQIGARFAEGLLHEDHLFSFHCIMNARRVWHSGEKFYIRSVHEGSIVTGPKTPQHVYGFLQSILGIAEEGRRLGLFLDSDLDRHISSELGYLRASLQEAYKALPNPAPCREKLTEAELLLLDTVMSERNLAELRRSRSYRLARGLSWPLRKGRAFLRSLRTRGLGGTLRRLFGGP